MADDLGITIGGDSSGAVAALAQISTAADREMKRTAQYIAYGNIAADVFEKRIRAAKAANDDFAATAGASAEGIDRARTATAGMTRELIVLAHEASQGNFKRFGGSLLVLAEYSGSATAVLHALVGPLGVAAAAIGAIGVAAFQGAHEQEQLAHAMILTANYAGLSSDEFRRQAQAAAAAANVTIGTAKSIELALAATGRFNPREIGLATEAVARMGKLSGEDSDKIVSDFARMKDGVTKWAMEADKSQHFLSTSQLESIRNLEQMAHSEEAVIAVLTALNAHLPTTASLWDKVWANASRAWDAMSGSGRPETPNDRLQAIDAQIAALGERSAPAGTGAGDYMALQRGTTGITRGQLEDQRRGALYDQIRVAEVAAGQADAARVSEASKNAHTFVDGLLMQIKGLDRLKSETTAAKNSFADAAADPKGKPVSAADQSAILDFYANQNRPAKAGSSSYTDRVRSLVDEGAKLQIEITNWQRYGKAIDDSTLAVLNLDLASGKLTGKDGARLTAAQIDAARQQAAADDELIRKKADVVAMFEAQNRAATDYIDAGKQLDKTLTDSSIAIDTQLAQLDLERQFLGLNTAARQALNAQLQIEKQRRDEIAKLALTPPPPGLNNGAGLVYGVPAEPTRADKINAAAAANSKKIGDGIMADSAAMQTFEYGAQKAFTQFQLDAANSAKFAETYVGGSLDRINDALVKFAETGKLSFTDLFSFMASEYLRNVIKMQEAGFLSNLSTNGDFSLAGIGNALTGTVNLGPDITSGAIVDALLDGGPLAAGGPVSPGSTYLVGEKGPELFRSNSAGTIIPNGQSGGTAIHVGQGAVYNIGQGVSRGEVVAAVQQGNAATETRIRRLISTGKIRTT